MEYIEGFANNKGVNIYYIDNGIKNSIKTPLLICPGLSECAKDYIKLINKFDDRRCVALSFRGNRSRTIATEATVAAQLPKACINLKPINAFILYAKAQPAEARI